MNGSRIRVLLAKVFIDGHDRGIKIVGSSLRDAGMEVVYTGLFQTPQEIVEAAIQEDVDVIGISELSGAHMGIFPEVLKLLKEKGADIMVIGGGIVPREDVAELKKMGVAEIFGPGTSTEAMVKFIEDRMQS